MGQALNNCKEVLKDCGSQIIMLSDRESDIYEYLQEADEISQNVILRVRGNRKEIAQSLSSMQAKGKYDFFHEGNQTNHKMCISYSEVTISPPTRSKEAQSKPLHAVTYNLVHVKEENPSSNTKAIEWILLTNLPINTVSDARGIIKSYSYRWHIENFHKVLKTSFKLEEAQVETFASLIVLATTMSILAYRLY